MRVFIGSSSQYKNYAEEIVYLLRKFHCEPVPWWQPNIFPLNETIIRSLVNNFNSCDAGLFLFSEDDRIVTGHGDFTSELTNSKPSVKSRDNVLFEYGLFAGINGMDKTVVAKLGQSETPTDLSGVHYMGLAYRQGMPELEFKNSNEELIKRWVEYQQSIAQQNIKFETIVNNLKKQAEHCPPDHKRRILDIILRIERDNGAVTYNESSVMDAIKNFLRSTKGIYGVDVTGPSGWQNPSVYRYLAPQLREYLRRNITEGNKFNLKVDSRIHDALEIAFNNARKFFSESYTEFDNDPEEFNESRVPENEVNLQYCRILLWSQEELMRPETEAIIIIHEAFHIPLFFLEADKGSIERKDDFLILEGVTGSIGDTLCFNSTRQMGYNDAYIVNNYKERSSLFKKFQEMLCDQRIMFAIDARKKIQEKSDVELNA